MKAKKSQKKLKGITSIFEESNVSVKTAASKEFAKNLSRVYFSGETIRQNGKQLGYYSTGTNSVQYIELLLKSIDEIAKTKLKEPIILIDEPEISLHPLYMDELSDVIANVGSKLRIIISTHSARLTKNLISDSERISLYNVKLIDQYSHVQHMKRFLQYSPESKYRVTDDHINSYFSRGEAGRLRIRLPSSFCGRGNRTRVICESISSRAFSEAEIYRCFSGNEPGPYLEYNESPSFSLWRPFYLSY